jgi:predicted PurR-regulated permease PerM
MNESATPRYHIDITPRSFLVIVIGIIGIVALWMVREFVLLIILAIIFASFVNSGVRLLKRAHIPRTIGVVLMYLFFIGIISVLVFVFFPLLFKELAGFIDYLPKSNPWTKLVTIISDQGLSGSTFTNIVGTSNLFQGIQKFWKLYLTDPVLAGISSIIQSIKNIFLVFIMSFFLSIKEGSLNSFLRMITPVQYEPYVINLWDRVEKKIGYWFGGQLIIALIAGIISFIGLSLLGMPYALLLSILIIILEFIPFGMIFGTIIIIPLAFFTGGISLGIPVTLFISSLNFFESKILQPLIVNKTVGVPMLLVIISIVAWIELIGWVGAFIAIPFAVLVLEIIYDREKESIINHDSLSVPSIE